MTSLPLLLTLTVFFGPPVMEHVRGAPQGIVVAAPHEGYDMYTGDMTRRVAKRLGWGWVVAKEYRDTKLERWVDVNRPTERAWVGSKRGKERETARGRAVFSEYLRRLRDASRVTEGQAIPLLVEFHGHNRKTKIGRETVRLDVIECATRGFTREELSALHARYERLAAQRWPVGPRIQLRFDAIHESYLYRGVTQRFYYKASGSKRAGSLQASVSKRALHFELPQNARSTKTQRAAFGQLFAELLEPLAKHGTKVSAGAAGAVGETPGD